MESFLVRNKNEDDMLRSLDKLRIYDEMMPKLMKIIEAGGSAEKALKNSESLAAATMIDLMRPEHKAEVRLNAANKIMERVSGKAVERSVSVYGDLNQMAEQDLDSQIKQLMGKLGVTQPALEAPKAKKIQKRKPRKNELLEAIVVDVVADAKEVITHGPAKKDT